MKRGGVKKRKKEEGSLSFPFTKVVLDILLFVYKAMIIEVRLVRL